MKRHGLARDGSTGNWLTPSGRYSVEFDVNYENECECIHCLDSRVADCRSAYPGQAAQKGWHVWDEHRGDYAKGSGYQTFDTMRAAAEFAMAAEGAS